MGNAIKRFRIEGLARGGRIMYAHVTEMNGCWRIYGPAGCRIATRGKSIQDALRRAGKKLPFRPIAIRTLESSAMEDNKPDSAT